MIFHVLICVAGTAVIVGYHEEDEYTKHCAFTERYYHQFEE